MWRAPSVSMRRMTQSSTAIHSVDSHLPILSKRNDGAEMKGTMEIAKPVDSRRGRMTKNLRIGIALSVACIMLLNLSILRLEDTYHGTRVLSNTFPDQFYRAVVVRNEHPLMIDYESGARLSGTVSTLPSELNKEEPTDARVPSEQQKAVSSEENTNQTAKECHFREWHFNQTYMHCNAMHELGVTDDESSIQFVHCGDARCVFRFQQDNHQQVMALKVERFRHAYSPHVWQEHRKDSMVMERLSSSPYIPNIYAACASSQLVEYATHGNLHDFIKLNRVSGRNMTSVDQLRICLQLAEGVAAVHSIEDDGVPSLSHDDIDCQQFVHVDGVFKLNDFHFAEYIPKNESSQEVCKLPNKSRFPIYYYRTRPAEAFDRETTVDPTKIDSYSLGIVMWYVLTNQWMWEGERLFDVWRQVRRGGRPPFPPRIKESKDPSIVAMRAAISHCWVHDPDKRATSVEIRNHLQAALKNVTGTKELDNVIRVAIPPLPANYRFTESDYSRVQVYQ